MLSSQTPTAPDVCTCAEPSNVSQGSHISFMQGPRKGVSLALLKIGYGVYLDWDVCAELV